MTLSQVFQKTKFSPLIIDFMDQCLQKDPALRPHTKELLNHPFVSQAHMIVEAQLKGPENGNHDHMDDALAELDEFAAAFIKSAKPETIEEIAGQFPNVSTQLGLGLQTVREKFLNHHNPLI